MLNPNPSFFDLDRLVSEYYPAVARLACSILNDEDEAQDAAQETFIAAVRASADFRGEASLKTWLFSIAVNQCRTRLRRQAAQRRMAQAVLAVQRLFGAVDSPENALERSDRDQQLWAAVDRLDEKHRLVVILFYVQELSAAEIADVLGVQEGTVHSRLHYARQQLARQLKRSVFLEEAAG
jgi:RNA polymerase sigma-70 factor (ECF subfamily)